MKVQIPTTNETFLIDYLRTINGILKLTKTELAVCVELIKTDINNPCSKDNRIKVARSLNWGRAVLNNTIKSLKDKRVLKYNNNNTIRYSFHPLIYNYKTNSVLNFEFVNKNEHAYI